jgi:uncharacterized membrane protein YhaH (DUF805 family)
MLDFFTGRSNRQEYWISVGLLILVALVLNYFNMQAASAAITIMWIVTWIRRLHDVSLSGWWAGLPILLLFILVGAAIAFGGNDIIAALRAIQADDETALAGPAANLFLIVALAGIVIQFGFTIWLGAKAGTPGKNKFGAPPEPLFPPS